MELFHKALSLLIRIITDGSEEYKEISLRSSSAITLNTDCLQKLTCSWALYHFCDYIGIFLIFNNTYITDIGCGEE